MNNTYDKQKMAAQLEWIATIRGIAALLVFLSHLPLNMPYKTRFVIGRIGVTAFFLISGYLAVGSRRNSNWKRYLLNRFFRIYPVYWILLLLMCLVMEKSKLTTWRIVANVTCFQEFLGQENILGASWMLPIQIVFFVILAIAGIEVFDSKSDGDTNGDKKCICTITLFSLLAIVVGSLRFLTGKPFPTAFFLLINVAFLGVFHKTRKESEISNKGWMIALGIFEATLIIAVIISYQDMFIHYVGAYNLGMLLMFLAEKADINIKFFKWLGSIGFTFFLGADIPYVLIKRFVDLSSTVGLRIVGSIVKFLLALLFAYIVTRYIEKPLQKKVRPIINRL